MKNEIAALGHQLQMAAQGLSHAALDAVALMGLAEHLAGCEADTWSLKRFAHGRQARGQEPAHRCGLALAGGRIGALIVGVLTKAHTRERLNGRWPRGLARVRAGRGGHGIAGGLSGREDHDAHSLCGANEER
jgi:hypothetical protein